MSSFNSTTLLGNLTADPQIRYTPSGTKVANYSLAVNRRYKQGDEWKTYTSYIDIVSFGRDADNVEKYVFKGDSLLVSGILDQQRWDDKDTGAKRSKVVVLTKTITFMPKRDRGQGAEGRAQKTEDRAQTGGVPDNVRDTFPDASYVSEGDIPF
jgi:single-strand DNA-binding protein